jgi:hypothetical protein
LLIGKAGNRQGRGKFRTSRQILGAAEKNSALNLQAKLEETTINPELL